MSRDTNIRVMAALGAIIAFIIGVLLGKASVDYGVPAHLTFGIYLLTVLLTFVVMLRERWITQAKTGVGE